MASLPPAADVGVLVKIKASSREAEMFVPNVQSALSTSMTNAGYKLITSEDAKPEVVANVTLNATEEKSFFAMQVNGQTQKSYKVTINASFVSAADAAVIDQTASDFSGKDGEIEQSAIDKLLVHLGKTGKLSAWANNSKVATEKEEDDLWKAANAEGCRKPQGPDACKGVEEYIKKYPSGKYTADGRQAMQDGEAERTKIQDEAAWTAAVVDICLKPTKSYDCKSVEDYLKKFPTGAHVADGKEAIKKSEKVREALAKKEAAEKKASSREDCVKSCRREYERAYAFELLVQRCIATECS